MTVAAEPGTCGLQWVSALPPGFDLEEVEHHAGTWVAVGDRGVILTSPDGDAWTLRHVDPALRLRAVARSSESWIAAGEQILTSQDGIGWTPSFGATGGVRDVACSAEMCVAVGALSGVLVSSGGSVWHLVLGGFAPLIDTVATDGELFAVVARTRPAAVRSSRDGIHWFDRGEVPLAAAGATEAAFRIVRTADEWLLSGDGRLFVSGDLEDWVEITPAWDVDVEALRADGDSVVASVSYLPDGADGRQTEVLSSADGGRTWASLGELPQPRYPGLAESAGRIVAIGVGGDVQLRGAGGAWSCPQGLCWAPGCRGFDAVTAVDGRWLAAGGSRCAGAGEGWLVSFADPSAPDVATFPERLTAVDDLAGVTVVGGASFVAARTGGEWVRTDLPFAVRALASSGVTMVAVGDGGGLAASADGWSWDIADLGDGSDLADVAWIPAIGRFVAVGDVGTIVTSGDGLVWIRADAPATVDLRGVGAVRQGALAVGAEGGEAAILASADGIAWERRPVASTLPLEDVAFDGELAVVVGHRGDAADPDHREVLLASYDAHYWTEYTHALARGLRAVVGTGAGLVAVGDRGGTILRAECVGVLAALEPRRVELVEGEVVTFAVVLSEPVDGYTDLEVVSADPHAVDVPPTVTVPDDSFLAVFTARAVEATPGTRVEVRLPQQLGGGVAASAVTVHPRYRRPQGRHGG